ncbi:MAG: hypothetical protein AAF658_17790, partial [Myxococcota bacterium]
MRNSIVLAALLSTAIACGSSEPEPFEGGGNAGETDGGSSGGPGFGGGDGLSDLAAFTSQALTAVCDYVDRCQATFGPVFESASQCETIFLSLVGEGDLFGPADVFSVNTTAANACLAAINTLSCDGAAFEDGLPGCDGDGVVVGVLPAGSCCDERGGCVPGTVCDAEDGELGTCVALGTEGQSCSLELDSCAEGLFCGESGDELVCQALPSSGESCGIFTGCAEPSVCIGFPNGTCGTPLGTGEACTFDEECESEVCGIASTCEGPDSDLPGLGEACVDECQSGVFGTLDCVSEMGGSFCRT